MGKELPPIIGTLFTEEQIRLRVQEMGVEIAQDYQDKDLVMVGILKGSFVFLADLSREVYKNGVNSTIDFMGIESYKGTESSRQPIITKDLSIDVSGKHVLIVEDIVDTGFSLDKVKRILEGRSVASFKICSLLSKPSAREVEVDISYTGFPIEKLWVEGYGLDTDQIGRANPDIVIRKT